MKILSLNCHGLPFTKKKRRFVRIAEVIKKVGADVVFLQEVVFVGDVKHFEDLGYQIYYTPWWKLVRGGLVVMSRRKSRKASFYKFPHQGKWLSRQILDRVLGKGFWGIELEEGGLTMVNAHLVRVYGRKAKIDGYQRKQLADLMGVIRRSEKVIVAGDLNIAEGSRLYQRLQQMVTDLTEGMGASFRKKSEKLDYVLVKGLNVEVKVRCFVDEMWPEGEDLSDHRGIYLELGEVGED